MLYVLTSGRGALLGWATDPRRLPPAPSGSVVVTREAWDAPPARPYVWDVQARDWVVPTPVVTTTMSTTAFRWRYTIAEQTAIKRAELEHPDPNVRATLAVLRESLAETPTVDVADPRTQQGVQFHASLGLLSAERAVTILTP